MPFVERKIEPVYLRQHQEKSATSFEEHIDVNIVLCHLILNLLFISTDCSNVVNLSKLIFYDAQ